MSRVCLIQCKGGEYGNVDAPALSTYNVAEPLGLLCLDAWLRKQGHEVLLLHPNLETGRILSTDDMCQRAVVFHPDLVGFSTMTNQVPASVELATRLRDRLPRVPIVVGGDHFSTAPQDLRHYACFDFAVCGEGEEALLWLVEFAELSPGQRPPQPNGVYRRDGTAVHGSGRTERVASLDSLPYAARYAGLLKWSEVGMFMWPPRPEQTGMASIYASRGCPYACSYCNARLVWGRDVNWRSPECVVNELRAVRQAYGVNTAFFVDLTFNANRDEVESLCCALEVADLGISWYVIARPGNPNDRIRLDLPLLHTMRRAGCVKIGFGVETVSPSVAKDLYRKGGNEYAFQICRWLDELGIISKAFLMMGHPTEDDDYYRYLADYMIRLGPDEVRISFLTPFPGTPLWEHHKHKLPGPSEYAQFTTFRPIMPHPLYSADALERIRLELLRKFYLCDQYTARVTKKIAQHPKLRESFDLFVAAVNQQISCIPENLRPASGGVEFGEVR